ncbi:unnamed protein product [Brassicogethes aeneus]|uniref:Formin-like protein n=1 Tax=Brassicogethes aeneus TaxID=1431903 RepID=A0A9P0B5N6_BRAAE|nr:unnamed protein product [Brassicogethes aeneus]
MGLVASKEAPMAQQQQQEVESLNSSRLHGRQASIRQSTMKAKAKQPMPEPNELERRFTKVLASMDLPPDKAKLLKSYDSEKKWDIICDQEMVQAKDPPSYYLNKLKTYLDPKASRSHRKRKMVVDSTSTQVLRDLEISLRTNHIEWVREFLNEDNQGLDVLIDYLSFRLGMMRHEQRIAESRSTSEEKLNPNAHSTLNSSNLSSPDKTNGYIRTPLEIPDSPSIRRRSKHVAKLNMGESKDDIHVCIMCMRAIMNNKYGFNMVIQHREAINCISLSLIHKSLRTKALVLELLAAICLVKGGHEIILSAFDNFKVICNEVHRFQTLMDYFLNFEAFHIEFMVACMQFVNIIVHSVEDMNFRVHLQYEFTALGLDSYLEKLRFTESEELQVQISAYLDNVFDVAALMEDSETKTAALEKVGELEDDLAQMHERLQQVEHQALEQIATLQTELIRVSKERDDIMEVKKKTDEEVTTLRRVVQHHEQESKNRQSMFESKIAELEHEKSLPRGSSLQGISDLLKSTTTAPTPQINTVSSSSVTPPPPPAPVAPPPPPCPPPPPLRGVSSSAPIPPPPAGLMQAPEGAMTIKRKVQTKHKLPTINWIALKPNQVRGTIFNELDDDKLHSSIDFNDFEERFKIGTGLLANGVCEPDGLSSFPSKRFKKPENVSLLEHTRLRNIAISRRKLEMTPDKVINAINMLDLKQLSLENVELLMRMVPTEQENKLYKEYVQEKKNINLLTEEDKFLLQLTKVDRISAKLSIMNYIANFYDNIHLITPQIHAIISGSNSVKNSRKLRSVLEIILAFGNYLNSSKRGPAYGFKLQSLDTLLDTKSNDKRTCLLHYIVATIRQKFPDLLNFESELNYIEKAALVSLENISTDVHELEKGMEAVRKEAEIRGKGSQSLVVRDFLANAEDKLKKLRIESKLALDAFRECVEFFAESPRTTDANGFFSLLVRFCKAFKASDTENEQRRRLELAAQNANNKTQEEVAKKNKINQKKQQVRFDRDKLLKELGALFNSDSRVLRNNGSVRW